MNLQSPINILVVCNLLKCLQPIHTALLPQLLSSENTSWTVTSAGIVRKSLSTRKRPANMEDSVFPPLWTGFSQFWQPVPVCTLKCFSVRLFGTPWTIAYQAPLFVGFSRQEHRSGLPCPPPRDLPNQGIKPESPASPVLQVDSLPMSHQEATWQPDTWLLEEELLKGKTFQTCPCDPARRILSSSRIKYKDHL